MVDPKYKIEELETIFSSKFELVSHQSHVSGRETFVARNDEGIVFYATYFPKLGNRINIDIYKREDLDDGNDENVERGNERR